MHDTYRVNLETFRGPLDLLLYLVRREEVDIFEIPIARITEQYLEYLNLLGMIDVDVVGDFLVMASTLMEIKSRILLPRCPDDGEEETDDPRNDLVQQLLEYKKFKDAASMLQERGEDWRRRFPRLADEKPKVVDDPARQPIREVELWDLVSAFGRLMQETLATAESSIVYDDTPIHVYMEQIENRLAIAGRVSLSELFQGRADRARIVGIFLALLELIRRQRIRAGQEKTFGDIWIARAEPQVISVTAQRGEDSADTGPTDSPRKAAEATPFAAAGGPAEDA